MEIKRIDGYIDARFSQTVLYQHGAYLVDGDPYEVEITGEDSAVVRGKDRSAYRGLIDEFRFHAPHITRFRDALGGSAALYPAPRLLSIPLDRIQPSQFYIDEDKLKAVSSFIGKPEDIVIQIMPYGDRFISLDGHTRLYLAVLNVYEYVRAVVSKTDDFILVFVREAERRNILHPSDMALVTHDEYVMLWDRYCDGVFAELGKKDKQTAEE